MSTREACQFRDYLLGAFTLFDRYPQLIFFSEKDLFKTSNVQIIGISPDSVEKQKDFVDKQHLNVR